MTTTNAAGKIMEKGFMKPKSMIMLCRLRTLHPIALALRRNAHAIANAKNASNITKRKAKYPTVQDSLFFSYQHLNSLNYRFL